MFHKKLKQKLSRNPEVLEAVKERDELVNEAAKASRNVDRLKDDLLEEYRLADVRRVERRQP